MTRRTGRLARRAWLPALLVLLAGFLVVRHAGWGEADRPRRPPTVACPPGEIMQGTPAAGAAALTPYPAAAPYGEFVQGATLDLSDTRPQDVPRLLAAMRSRHHINTVSVYGLERWDPPGNDRNKDRLFAELARQSMMIAVRLEAYQADRFAFTGADAGAVLDSHRALLSYVSAPVRRDRLAYVSLNMPVDDPGVQRRLGGVDSPLSIDRQPSYAVALVRGVRDAMPPGVPVYLGLFYGWDNTYDVPSYAVAGADGYVLTNYSYPAGAVPGAGADDATLINEPRLRVAVDRAVTQYGDRTPLVVEYGFHTAARHRGAPPAQQAGLVADVAAKRRALLATNRFYCGLHPAVRGTMYFGFNIVKPEGDPPALLDFALAPPV